MRRRGTASLSLPADSSAGLREKGKKNAKGGRNPTGELRVRIGG